MSSRALRRLQNDSAIGLWDVPGCDEEINGITEVENGNNQLQSKKKRKGKHSAAPVNPFELLDSGLEESGSVSDKEVDSNDDAEKIATPVEKPVSKSKKKKKSKKKQKGNENITQSTDEKDVEDEVEASVQEVNRILGEANLNVVVNEKGGASKADNMKSLLHIDHRNLNPETELKRMFGAQVVRGEQQQERHRRQRNRPVQRASRLVQPKDNWHPTGGSGLSMKFLGQEEGFTFDHSPAYQRLQHQFCDAVESGQPEAIVNILQMHPYHIDALIQMADFHRMNEDFQTGAEFIEKALYGMECAFHSLFNIASGNCLVSYRRPENRAFFLCVFKHILHLGRRGCNRTAFEFCKLLLSLDPADDPLDCMSMIDFYALRSQQYDYLLRLETEALSPDASKRVPNFAFSIALAHYKDAVTKGKDTDLADARLQEALLFFPVMLVPLLDQCSVQPDKRVSGHSFFNSTELADNTSELGRLVTLYVKRCEPCWKEPEVMTWLERNVQTVMDLVDSGTDQRVRDYANLRKKGFRKPPLSLLRHYFLSEIQGVSPPQRFLTSSVLSYDPFPPPNSIISYTRPTRPTIASQSESGFIRSFLESLRPSYNPNELPQQRNRGRGPEEEDDDEDGAVGGARAIPAQIQESVQAIMEAMRNLLHDPLAQVQPREDAEEEGQWEDEGEEVEEEAQR